MLKNSNTAFSIKTKVISYKYIFLGSDWLLLSFLSFDWMDSINHKINLHMKFIATYNQFFAYMQLNGQMLVT